MPSHKTSSLVLRHSGLRGRTTRRTFAGVRISSGLIAFYPAAIHRPQPYVILLDPSSGILRRLDLQTTK